MKLQEQFYTKQQVYSRQLLHSLKPQVSKC